MLKFIEYLDYCLPDEVYEKMPLKYDFKKNRYVFKKKTVEEKPQKSGVIGKIEKTVDKVVDKAVEKIDSIFHKRDMSKLLYTFKRETLDKMDEEFEIASSRGVINDDVFVDMVISRYPNLEADFEKFCSDKITEEKNKNKAKYTAIGSAVYIALLVALYLAISFYTQQWAITWLIMANGILGWVSYLLTFGVVEVSRLRRMFHIIARVLLAVDVMVISVALFLYTGAYLGSPMSWLIVIAGIAAMFICDGIFVTKMKQRLAVLNILIYIPIISTMLFIIMSATGVVAWSNGWLLIIAGLGIDAVIAGVNIYKNKLTEREVYAGWSEN